VVQTVTRQVLQIRCTAYRHHVGQRQVARVVLISAAPTPQRSTVTQRADPSATSVEIHRLAEGCRAIGKLDERRDTYRRIGVSDAALALCVITPAEHVCTVNGAVTAERVIASETPHNFGWVRETEDLRGVVTVGRITRSEVREAVVPPTPDLVTSRATEQSTGTAACNGRLQNTT